MSFNYELPFDAEEIRAQDGCLIHIQLIALPQIDQNMYIGQEKA